MATLLVGVVREMLARVPAPRNVLARFRLGQVLGEPGNAVQQRAVLADVLSAFVTITRPGGLLELPYRWKRSVYQDPLASRARSS